MIVAHCEEAVERAGGVPPIAAVVDGDHAAHVWPLEWEWLHDDAAARRLWRERLLEEARAVAGREDSERSSERRYEGGGQLLPVHGATVAVPHDAIGGHPAVTGPGGT
jgi:hypothetical protein